MVRQDILTGLKNAVERGYSIDVAVSSFTNAGYKAEEVQEAAALISSSVPAVQPKPAVQAQTALISPQLKTAATLAQQPQQLPQMPAQQPVQMQQILAKERQKGSGKRIVLVVMLAIIFLLLAGFLLFLVLPGFAELREEFFSIFG